MKSAREAGHAATPGCRYGRPVVADGIPHSNECNRATSLAEARDAEHAVSLDEVMKQRDDYEEFIGNLAADLGCTEEWSNLHTHLNCLREIVPAAAALADAKREAADWAERASLARAEGREESAAALAVARGALERTVNDECVSCPGWPVGCDHSAPEVCEATRALAGMVVPAGPVVATVEDVKRWERDGLCRFCGKNELCWEGLCTECSEKHGGITYIATARKSLERRILGVNAAPAATPVLAEVPRELTSEEACQQLGEAIEAAGGKLRFNAPKGIRDGQRWRQSYTGIYDVIGFVVRDDAGKNWPVDRGWFNGATLIGAAPAAAPTVVPAAPAEGVRYLHNDADDYNPDCALCQMQTLHSDREHEDAIVPAPKPGLCGHGLLDCDGCRWTSGFPREFIVCGRLLEASTPTTSPPLMSEAPAATMTSGEATNAPVVPDGDCYDTMPDGDPHPTIDGWIRARSERDGWKRVPTPETPVVTTTRLTKVQWELLRSANHWSAGATPHGAARWVAMRALEKRGLVVSTTWEPRVFKITDAGRTALAATPTTPGRGGR